MKIATLQYTLEPELSFDQLKQKIEELIQSAVNAGCKLILFPEYAGVEIGGLQKDDIALYEKIQNHLPDYLNLFTSLAKTYQLYIQPGTTIIKTDKENYINRAYFFSPTGKYAYQDKLNLITFEKQLKVIKKGDQQTIFTTSFANIGIAICYDVEFPEVVKNLVDGGANLILVPSYTISRRGFHRVFNCAAARAIENQCYVVLSFMVGIVPELKTSETTTGKAAVFTPIDIGLPENGIAASGTLDKTEMIIANLDFHKLIEIQKSGEVQNLSDRKSLHLSAVKRIIF